MTNQEIAKVGSLWIGGPLSWIELASLHSFVKTGHDYALYAYDDIPNVPNGVQLRDAREIWDTDEIIYHTKTQSPAIHADIFRALMVQETARVWVDTDVVAIRPLPTTLKWYIGHERSDRVELGNAIMGLPENSKTLKMLTEFLTAEFPVPPWVSQRERKKIDEMKQRGEKIHLGNLAWGATGPKALTYFATQTGEIEYAQPQEAFFPISFQQRKYLTDPHLGSEVTDIINKHESYCVHLYSRWLRKFTKGMLGQVPKKTSWLGAYLASEGLVDYDVLEDEQRKKRKRQKGNRPLPEIDADSFYNDLEARRKRLSINLNTSPHGRITAVTMAKDEGPYILEWVAHHHLLGFTEILVYTNDCSDGTAEMFDALHSIGVLTHYDNPDFGTKPPQSRALKRAGNHPLVKDSDWVMVIDLDEFVSIRHGDGTVNSLIDVIKEKNATAMSLTWRFFGSANQVRYEERPVTERFQRAANNEFTPGFGVKTLFKTDDRIRLGIHRPRMKRKSKENSSFEFNWVNGSGKPVDGKVMSWRQTLRSVGYDLAQVNHYGVKSYEEFLMRRLRGDVLNNHGKYDATYFHRFDRNEIKDDIGLKFAEERSALISYLRRFKAVREAEAIIKNRYQGKVEKLRSADNYRQLIDELKSKGA